jgi:SAM-dependent methyltransferase
MTAITKDAVADLFFELKWRKNNIRHTDNQAGPQVNIWRDLLPAKLVDGLMGLHPGDQLQLDFAPAELTPPHPAVQPRTLKRNAFDPTRTGHSHINPRYGRFYPKGMLKDLPGVYKQDIEPFRCVHVDDDALIADLGHPLARDPLRLRVTVGSIQNKEAERGGSVRDWAEILTRGPGMQACWNSQPTDFLSDDPFTRKDEQPDIYFYKAPRMVRHIDTTALDLVRQLYARFIEDGMQVLDLMGSWQSHLPTSLKLARLTGLGLNAEELQSNAQLSDYQVHDLNADPILPLTDKTYDAVICSLSVEYLIHPVAVFREVARVLKPGGRLIVTFSNRWFEPKTTRIWTELHEFERMGLVLDYFRRSGEFKELETYSVRGLTRPHDDKYFGQIPNADPIYAVWGQRAVPSHDR